MQAFGDHCGGGIKNWVFTPSFCSADNGAADKKLLDRSRCKCYDTLSPWTDYVEVLVVRARQVAAYRELFGSSHIIVSLPGALEDSLEGVEHSDTLGIGYARLFVQLLAYELELDAVWMLDDNVDLCYKMLCDGDTVRADNSRFVNCSFADVMTHIEGLVAGKAEAVGVNNQLLPSEFLKHGEPTTGAQCVTDVTEPGSDFVGISHSKAGVVIWCSNRGGCSPAKRPGKFCLGATSPKM